MRDAKGIKFRCEKEQTSLNLFSKIFFLFFIARSRRKTEENRGTKQKKCLVFNRSTLRGVRGRYPALEMYLIFTFSQVVGAG
jgi:hypothetical protein